MVELEVDDCDVKGGKDNLEAELNLSINIPTRRCRDAKVDGVQRSDIP